MATSSNRIHPAVNARRIACRPPSLLAGLFLIALSLPVVAASGGQGCPPPALVTDAGSQTTSIDEMQRQQLAIALLDCLGHPDPALRDTLAYTTLSTWMRDGKLTPETLQRLRGDLLAYLQSPDADGFRAPFAALVLSEVMRVDRIAPFLDQAQRRETLAAATAYLRDVRDYRGFVDGEGWRHGVAHGADVLLQLTLNPALGEESAKPILDAIASQVGPSSVAYRFGEEGRLARVVVAVASRGWVNEVGWTAWFAQLADPAPLASWNDAFNSEAALNRLHNLRAFLLALHVRVAGNDGDAATSLMTGLRPVIKMLP